MKEITKHIDNIVNILYYYYTLHVVVVVVVQDKSAQLLYACVYIKSLNSHAPSPFYVALFIKRKRMVFKVWLVSY